MSFFFWLYVFTRWKRYLINPYLPMFQFCTPWKHQETEVFLMFSGGVKWKHRPETGYLFLFRTDVPFHFSAFHYSNIFIFFGYLWPQEIWTFKPTIIYLFKVNNRNIRERCEICSKLTAKTERLQWRRSDVSIVIFEHISYLFQAFL